jgi:FMN phosphatase YigB (HAD superfamily)
MMKTTVRAAELPTLLDDAPEGLEILSLDCFDTLLWRNVHRPTDIFADLPIPGGGILSRSRCEGRARVGARFAEERDEVSIEEIYSALYPAATDAIRSEAIALELAAEARHCYGFAPVAALMRAAKARGLKIIIVSDTYLSEPQLRTLIEAAAGEEIASQIDRIFCSSEYGVPKAGGLFRYALADLGVSPGAVLHVGDNVEADHDAPAELGVHGVHFRQFDAAAAQRLRLEASAASILDPAVRVTDPPYQPHRPAISLRESDDPVWALGHDVLGPIMYAFAAWVRREVAEMSERLGKPVKPLFVLRDGHLPRMVHDAMDEAGGISGTVEVSRFTARRAAFVDADSIRDYLATQSRHERIDVLARQLGLTADEYRKLSRQSQVQFGRSVLIPGMVRRIVKRSAEFADRLFAHFQAQGVEPGDAVMLVDLGYNGTVQNEIGPLLEERFGLTVAGRYLLLREHQLTGMDKKGLIDARHCDVAGLQSLCGSIALVEQLCTIAQGSVVDYGRDGTPVRKGPGAKGAQNAIRDRLQQGCVAFAGSASAGFVRPAASDGDEARRLMALGALARLLFMPTAAEVEIFQAFEHDVNLGTDDMTRLLDVTQSAEGLRRRGLFYLAGVDRMFLPGEIQPHGLPLNLALFAANRFNMDLRAGDFRAGALKLPVIVADDRSQTVIEVDAYATHDGYYVATIPVGAGRFAVGIQFGALCEWLQLEEASYYPVADYMENLAEVRPVDATPIFEGMTAESGGLYRCGPNALMLAPPPAGLGPEAHLLAVTFRPVAMRAAEAEIRQAA